MPAWRSRGNASRVRGESRLFGRGSGQNDRYHALGVGEALPPPSLHGQTLSGPSRAAQRSGAAHNLLPPSRVSKGDRRHSRKGAGSRGGRGELQNQRGAVDCIEVLRGERAGFGAERKKTP